MSALSLGGREPRSPTPHHHPLHVPRSHSDNDLAVKTRFTDFFIETILGPEFGGSRKPSKAHHRKEDEHEVERQDRTNVAKRCDEARPVGAGEKASTKSSSSQSWPAWVYCTRYSDRPSSGETTFLKRFTVFLTFCQCHPIVNFIEHHALF